jgi:pimeloyl-ACP methyl ester carboxylesterase
LPVQRVNVVDFDIQTPAGRLRARRHGDERAPLVLALPGLTANLASFDYIGEHLGGDLQLVALDLRGRGFSDAGPAGSYGWQAHARDVFAAADGLGARRFAVVGWSMGGLVAMQMAALDATRLERVALIDIATTSEPDWTPVIRMSVDRLKNVVPSRAAYLEAVKEIGIIDPWSEFWDRYFAYELEDFESGVRARTRYDAADEDFEYGLRRDASELWPHLTMPVLLLRAQRPMLPGTELFIVKEHQRDALSKAVAHLEVVEVDANHYTIATSPVTVEALRRFLSR